MFGFFSKKYMEYLERFGEKRAEELDEIRSVLGRHSERLEAIEAGLQQTRRADRRRDSALDTLLGEQAKTLDLLAGMKSDSPNVEAILSFAEAFILWSLGTERTEETRILSGKLEKMLGGFGIESVAEINVPFDPALHEACAVRNEPSLPDRVVLEIVRPGFLCHGRTARCASVVVNRTEEGEN